MNNESYVKHAVWLARPLDISWSLKITTAIQSWCYDTQGSIWDMQGLQTVQKETSKTSGFTAQPTSSWVWPFSRWAPVACLKYPPWTRRIIIRWRISLRTSFTALSPYLTGECKSKEEMDRWYLRCVLCRKCNSLPPGKFPSEVNWLQSLEEGGVHREVYSKQCIEADILTWPSGNLTWPVRPTRKIFMAQKKVYSKSVNDRTCKSQLRSLAVIR